MAAAAASDAPVRSPVDAIVSAGQLRLRPSLMTTLTTVLGLIPMAFYAGEGAEIRQPMAVTSRP